MNLLKELLHALLTVGLPLSALAFVMVWWALGAGLVKGTSAGDIQRDIDALGKRQSKKKDRQRLNPVHDKWFRFGGGFYGLVALYTWLLIEWDEIYDLVTGLGDLLFRLDINILVNFIIGSVMNFVTAIAWPFHWMGKIDNGRPWLWLLIAYLGYRGGVLLAQRVFSGHWGKSQFGFVSRLLGREENDG